MSNPNDVESLVGGTPLDAAPSRCYIQRTQQTRCFTRENKT
jgi:hypothetical protein